MNAPRTPTASTVAPLLATLAVFCATLRARVLASVWRAPSPFPLFGAWPAPGFFFAVDPADPDEAARAIVAAGYTLTEPTPKAMEALAPALSHGRPTYVHDVGALAVFVESLPAIVTHVELWTPGTSTHRAVSAAHLRAMLCGVSGRVVIARAVYRDTERNQNAPAVVFEGETWRALLRSYDPDAITPTAPRFEPARPVALACARCGVVATTRFETAADAHTAALARRWTLRDTDEGETYACRPCSAQTSTATKEATR